MKNYVLSQLNKRLIYATGNTRLFYLGLKGQLQNTTPKPYNFYFKLIGYVLTICFGKWLLDFKKMEMDVRGYNWLVPQYVYKVRQQSHMYWQLARIARRLPTTFTYYKWDGNLMFQIDRQGQQKAYQSHRQIQSPSTLNSVFHEYIFPAPPQRHAQIMMYLKNIDNPYDLFNYLRNKTVNMGDWGRALFFLLYRETGFTNRWRYDQFVSKPQICYRWEKIKLAYRISRDRLELYKILDQFQVTSQDIMKYLIWLW